MKILRIIFRLPMIPFIILLSIYIILKIYKNTSNVDLQLLRENNGSLLTTEIKDKIVFNLEKYNILNNVICMCLWYIIIMTII